MADVLPKLIGWLLAIPSVMNNEIASYKPASHYIIKRWRQSCFKLMISGEMFCSYYFFKAFLVINDV